MPKAGNASLSRDKDGKLSRLITVVRERWDAYQIKEKRFSKEFALALINLHRELAKPGHGSFVEKLNELKIPTATAYRLMALHGWKQKKQIGKSKPERTIEDQAADHQKVAERSTMVYLEPFKKEPQRLWIEMTELFERVASKLGFVILVTRAEDVGVGRIEQGTGVQ